MIKVTTRDGTEMYLNPDLIELITETPDTHITLSNGNRYLVLEPARVVISRIVNFKAHVFRHVSSSVARRYLRKRDAENYHPNCRI
ncbi:flagellar FlbD family protein [Geomonas propionica]|uniref:Flagellar FlbD family protein n=1 Tax=Geomonas propionica TaxID=2798582 RepID=A0ABS0YT97_9BACT|nr:flagellar FlbD family protein [Geomonas propionica]MBJ6801196.1 flagellar FlbD family protein [Geomonas propionica]